MACSIKYINDRYSEFPKLIERLTNIEVGVWKKLNDSKLFREYERTLLFSKKGTKQYNDQKQLLSNIDKSLNTPSSVFIERATKSGFNNKVTVSIHPLAQIEYDKIETEEKSNTLLVQGDLFDGTQLNDEPFIKEGVNDIFQQSPELANIGTQEQYSQYLDSIFPDSKVKDIVYHGSFSNNIEKFTTGFEGSASGAGEDNGGFYFIDNKETAEKYKERATTKGDKIGKVYSVLINLKEGNGIDGEFLKDSKRNNEYVVYEGNQIHILGNKTDIEGFNNWVREDVYNSDDRDDQGDKSEQEELAYIEEENIDNEDIAPQNDVSLESEDERIMNEMINNGEIQTYCN